MRYSLFNPHEQYRYLRDKQERRWELVKYLQLSGRRCTLRGVTRLIAYWTLRTELSELDVIDTIYQDLQLGFPIGLRKYGHL